MSNIDMTICDCKYDEYGVVFGLCARCTRISNVGKLKAITKIKEFITETPNGIFITKSKLDEYEQETRKKIYAS